MKMLPVPVIVTLLALIGIGFIVLLFIEQLFIIAPVSILMVIMSSILLSYVIKHKQKVEQ